MSSYHSAFTGLRNPIDERKAVTLVYGKCIDKRLNSQSYLGQEAAEVPLAPYFTNLSVSRHCTGSGFLFFKSVRKTAPVRQQLPRVPVWSESLNMRWPYRADS